LEYWSNSLYFVSDFNHRLCGYKPFRTEGDDDELLFDKIKKGEFTFPSEEWDDISGLAKDLVKRLLETDPAKRLDADGIMNHPWMKATEQMDSEESESDPD